KIIYEKTTQTTFKSNSVIQEKNKLTSHKLFASINDENRKKPSFVICSQCGSHNDSQDIRCKNCGSKLRD
ncbi:MAG: zinc ribbon domain-containing protein, partial [Candidatus Odinarchaeota archaeon]